MKRILLALLLATTASARPAQYERIVLASSFGLFNAEGQMSAVKDLLDMGWTVKHIVPVGESSQVIVIVLVSPSPEWEAYNVEQARLKREQLKAQREAKAAATQVEKGKP